MRVDVGYFVSGDRGGPVQRRHAGVGGRHARRAAPTPFATGGSSSERSARHCAASTAARPAISIGASEQFALPRLHPGLREVGVWLGWFGPASRPLQALSGGDGARDAAARRAPRDHRDGRRLVRGSTGGPDAATARAGALARSSRSRPTRRAPTLATVRIEGASPYDFTAGMLAWAAMRAAERRPARPRRARAGRGFGLDELEAGVAEAGIRRAC